jgi:fermentation-respiration switch protein FrsA (DUF1100 family)
LLTVGAAANLERMKQSVTFCSQGLNVAGVLFTPKTGEPHPAIVIGHPVTSVKEQSPSIYARSLVEKGFVVLVFDATYQGESEGEPRLLEDPIARSENIKDAVSFLTTRDDVDPERIGALGICGSGAYVPFAAQTDRRIKAVATISAVNFGDMLREGADLGGQDPAILAGQVALSNQARTDAANGRTVEPLPLLPMSEEEAEQTPGRSMMREAYDFYRTPRCMHPNAPSKIAVQSFDLLAQWDGWEFITDISPRPLLMIAGTAAETGVHSERAIERAAEPKELFWVEGASHVDLYGDREQFRPIVVDKLTEFFDQYLGAPAR